MIAAIQPDTIGKMNIHTRKSVRLSLFFSIFPPSRWRHMSKSMWPPVTSLHFQNLNVLPKYLYWYPLPFNTQTPFSISIFNVLNDSNLPSPFSAFLITHYCPIPLFPARTYFCVSFSFQPFSCAALSFPPSFQWNAHYYELSHAMCSSLLSHPFFLRFNSWHFNIFILTYQY